MQEEQIRPQSFKDFAGQRKTLDNLEVFVAAAKNRGGALDHVLLHGPQVWENNFGAYYCQ